MISLSKSITLTHYTVLIKASDGACPVVNCKKLKCTKEMKWICATPADPNGKPSSFANDCERLQHNCNNPDNSEFCDVNLIYDFHSLLFHIEIFSLLLQSRRSMRQWMLGASYDR